MNNDEYFKYIKDFLPLPFESIYIIDMMADIVKKYKYENEKFTCIETIPFTSFYANLENVIHHDDLKGYVDNISPNNIQEQLNEGKSWVRYNYRQKNEFGEFSWYSNIIKLLSVENKRLAIVLVESMDSNLVIQENSSVKVENLEEKQKFIFAVVSETISKLNGVININCTTNNPEIKSIIEYVSNTLVDLSNTFPELNKALAEDMIASTNQGKTKTLLIVDDDNITCNLLSKTFEDSYKIIIANNGREAIEILEKNNDTNDLDKKDKIVGMFLDLNMPIINGFGVLDYMNSKNLLNKMPVIIISGDYDEQMRDRAYSYPIADVLEKPFNVKVIKHRIRNLIKLYKSNNSLNEIVLTQHQEIKNVLRTIVKSYLCDYANDIRRVTSYVNVLAKQLTLDFQEYNFDKEHISKMMEAAKYYNIGLYVLPRNILKKESFSEMEERIISNYPYIGLSIFNSVLYNDLDRIFNHYAKDIIQYNNENYDGTGYPSKLKGDDIPIVAQIVSLAIEYANLLKTNDENVTINTIINMSGTKFNPKIIESFKKVIDEIKKINASF